MIYISLSVLLFGLMHPLSKFILESGIPLSYFCVLYVGIRLFVLVPTFLYRSVVSSSWSSQQITGKWKSLIFLGLCGAGLQFFEFKGIDEGLPPGVVTFLLYSYPVWILIGKFFQSDKSSLLNSILRVSLSLSGIYLVSQFTGLNGDVDPSAYIYPVIGSVFLAIWVGLSNQLRKQNLDILSLSFFYDMFSLISLGLILQGHLKTDWMEFSMWIKSDENVFIIIFYSLVVGLLPNLFFYYGVRFVPSLVASLALSFEPVLSTLYSSIYWKIELGEAFIFGAILLTLANLPRDLKGARFRLRVTECHHSAQAMPTIRPLNTILRKNLGAERGRN